MPIYEFRCLKCNEVFEILFSSSDGHEEMICRHCGAEDIERIMSRTYFSVAPSPGTPRASATTKSCGAGSCSTLEIPGIGD